MTTIVVVPGDGIGTAITDSVKTVLAAAGATLTFEDHRMGKNATPAEIDAAMLAFERTGVMLKGPTETPVATEGKKSFNVTSRKGHALYVNMRRSQSYEPIVETHFPQQDITIFRENEEGLYAAIEHQHTPDGVQALSIKSKSGMHKIIRAAFEYAVLHRKTKVCCMHKGNILKKTEGTFLEIFKEIAQDYPGIEATSQIIDDGMAKVATQPNAYQVIVTENLFGDILSDITTQLTGSLGLGGSANIGVRGAMFEAIHGTGPDIIPGGTANPTPEHIANPSGLLQAAILMLEHAGGEANLKAAAAIRTAWLWTLEDGIHTGDLARMKQGKSTNPTTKRVVGTVEFTNAIVERTKRILAGEKSPVELLARLDREPALAAPLHAKDFAARARRTKPFSVRQTLERTAGVDIFVKWTGLEDPSTLAMFHAKSGVALESIVDVTRFATLEEAYACANWARTTLQEFVQLHPTTVSQSLAELDLFEPIGSLLIEIGISGSATDLGRQARAMALKDLLTALNVVSRHHQTLAAATSASLGRSLAKLATANHCELEMISNRGQCVYPNIMDPDLVDQMRCRFVWTGSGQGAEGEKAARRDLFNLLTAIENAGFRRIKTEGLHEFMHPGTQKWVKGYGESYGQGMGARTESLL